MAGRARAAKDKELEQLLTADYRMPTIGDEEPKPLGRFPNEKYIKSATDLVGQLTAQAKGLTQESVMVGHALKNAAVPIVTVDDRTIGSGRPGPITRRLLDAFRQATR